MVRNRGETMRVQYTVLSLVLSCFLASQADAQANQYKRASTKKAEVPAVPPPAGKAGDAKSATTAPKKDSEKLDISDLEQKYWAPKDTDFKVVQNRKYSKDHKVGVSLQVGPIFNNPYTSGYGNAGLTAAYYFTEFTGVELNYTNYQANASELVKGFTTQYGGVMPNFSMQKSYYGANYNWIPIYGKMSLLDSRIVYFDLAISPGLGMTNYEQQFRTLSPRSKSALTYSLDFSQHFFFNEKIALRFDFKNRFFNEDVAIADGVNEGKSDSTRHPHTVLLQVGFTYYFGQGVHKVDEGK